MTPRWLDLFDRILFVLIIATYVTLFLLILAMTISTIISMAKGVSW